MQLAIVIHKKCHFKFWIQSRDAKGLRVQIEGSQFFLSGHKGDSQFNLPVEIIVEIRMVYVIRASSFNHIVTHTFFGAILHKISKGDAKT